MDQYIVPYFMSSHPGSTLHSAIALAQFLKKSGQRPEQVQDFYPTPGTLSTCMFYTGLDPRDMRPVYVPKDPKEKAMQRALMQYFMPQYRSLVIQALYKTGNEELIPKLLPPRPSGNKAKPQGGGRQQAGGRATAKSTPKGRPNKDNRKK